MRVTTSREMLKIEEQAESSFGLDTGLLMERAGQAVADEAMRMLPEHGSVVIVCGKGNNGGDGFVAARLLDGYGYKVTVVSLAGRDDFPLAARNAYDKLPSGVQLVLDLDLATLEQNLKECDLVIDAIFGFSLKGAVRGPAVEVIDLVNRSGRPVLSVDLPSGLEADTGEVYSGAVVADVTVTFTAPKVGMLLYPGQDYVGEYVIADIGIPESLVEEYASFHVADIEDVRAQLPARGHEAHKKSVGQVLVVAGSRGMAGAAVLSAKGAYRAGAGLVGFAPPQSIAPILNAALIEAIVYAQPETASGALASAAFESITELSSRYDAVALGPGLSIEAETTSLVKQLVEETERPLVVDASALTCLVGSTDILRKRKAPTIITPHVGEMARLFNVSPEDVLCDRLGFAKRAQEEFSVVVVLKGARTIICGPGETTINLTGNPGLATAGTGDVLTGVVAAFLAQGMSAYDAAWAGVYLHGLSADIAVGDINEYSLMASDVIDYLPEAINHVL